MKLKKKWDQAVCISTSTGFPYLNISKGQARKTYDKYLQYMASHWQEKCASNTLFDRYVWINGNYNGADPGKTYQGTADSNICASSIYFIQNMAKSIDDSSPIERIGTNDWRIQFLISLINGQSKTGEYREDNFSYSQVHLGSCGVTAYAVMACAGLNNYELSAASIDSDSVLADDADLLPDENSSEDTASPEINISCPAEGALYVLNQKVLAAWEAIDDQSGIETSAATDETGKAIDTGSVGTKTFIVTATDSAGNSASKKISYKVVYAFGGILSPIKSDGSSTFKPGSTIPVKFQLKDKNGKFITNASAKLIYEKLDKAAMKAGQKLPPTSFAAVRNKFNYNMKGKLYTYNINTKGWPIGTYLLTILLDDDISYKVSFKIK